jgi:hypothetical protein
VRDQDLDNIRPSAVAMTAEVFAGWAYEALAATVRLARGESLTVRVRITWPSGRAGRIWDDALRPARGRPRGNVGRTHPT